MATFIFRTPIGSQSFGRMAVRLASPAVLVQKSKSCARAGGSTDRDIDLEWPAQFLPETIHVDNGREFSGQIFDLWACHHKAAIDFNRPGKPTDNSFVDSFNGSLRDECLTVHWFETIYEVKEKIEAWRVECNENRPPQVPREMTRVEFALECRTSEQ